MANYFAIYQVSGGALKSIESDEAQNRLSAPQLAALGLARVSIAAPLGTGEQWNTVTHTIELVPAAVIAVGVEKPFDKQSAQWTTADVADALKSIKDDLLQLSGK